MGAVYCVLCRLKYYRAHLDGPELWITRLHVGHARGADGAEVVFRVLRAVLPPGSTHAEIQTAKVGPVPPVHGLHAAASQAQRPPPAAPRRELLLDREDGPGRERPHQAVRHERLGLVRPLARAVVLRRGPRAPGPRAPGAGAVSLRF